MSTNEVYDPTAPDGDTSQSQYVTKKDIRVVGAALIVLAAACYPLFLVLKRRAERSACATNMGAISTSITQYAELHDERFPPLMRTEGMEPGLGNTGLPYTWASQIDELMPPRSSFKCPSAEDKEITWVEGPGTKIPLTYGMYVPLGGTLRNVVANPDQTILLSETSNAGSAKTYDPQPYKAGFDGFAIGWEDSNDNPSGKSKRVTRLAFPGTAGGVFSSLGETRHENGIHGLNCNGAMVTLKPQDANVVMSRGLPGGLWQVPPLSGVRP